MYGTNIKRIRKKKKITQQGLAKRIGVSRQAVCMWETDKREIKAPTLKKIAQIFSVRPGEILNEAAVAANKKVSKIIKSDKVSLTNSTALRANPGPLGSARGGKRSGERVEPQTKRVEGLTRKGDGMRETVMSLAKKKGKEEGLMKKTQGKTTFTVMAPKAGRVAVTGSFNSWDKTGASLKKDKNGAWTGELSLKPGKYEYKFIVDGQWWTDPANKSTVRNSFGSDNSVIEIKG